MKRAVGPALAPAPAVITGCSSAYHVAGRHVAARHLAAMGRPTSTTLDSRAARTDIPT